MAQPIYTLEVYQIDLANNKFVRLDEIITFHNFSYTQIKNQVGQMQFSLNILDKKATPNYLFRYKTQILVKRNGIAVWLGHIRKIQGNLADNNGNLQIQCLEYINHLSIVS